MNVEDVRNYCLNKNKVEENLPFDETTLVFKVCNKIFALLSLEGDMRVNLKCNPEKAVELREQYSFVTPGYHMNKKHWNTIDLKLADDRLVKEWIDDSYHLVLLKNKKKLKK